MLLGFQVVCMSVLRSPDRRLIDRQLTREGRSEPKCINFVNLCFFDRDNSLYRIANNYMLIVFLV